MRAYASMYRLFRPTAISGHTRLTSGHTRLTSGHTRLISGHKRQRPIMQYRRQWPPGSPSLPYRTFPWRTAQRPARVGICPLSTPLLSPPLSRAFFAGLSIGCSGGRGVPVSGPFCLHPRTTSTCRRLGVRIVSSTFPLARALSSVGRI